jgi:hypothetical protein
MAGNSIKLKYIYQYFKTLRKEGVNLIYLLDMAFQAYHIFY